MNFLKLNGVKTLSKATQQKIKGGWSSADKNRCMSACMSQPNPSSYECAVSCCIIERVGVTCG